MISFLKLFHSDEARQYAGIALAQQQARFYHRAASFWLFAYQTEKAFRDNEALNEPDPDSSEI
jgi:hypothetical protein